MTSRSGRVSAGAKSQHKDLYRKLLLRRSLYGEAEAGAIYVPFIGDGDIALELYTDRDIWGADLDPARVATAQGRLPGSIVVVGDCNGWPFRGHQTPAFAIADLDPYVNPYLALDSFLGHPIGSTPLSRPLLTQRLVIYGTDGFRQWIMRRHGLPSLPSGEGREISDGVTLDQSRPVYNFWWPRHVLPYLADRVAPRRILRHLHYQTHNMLYWGMVIE